MSEQLHQAFKEIETTHQVMKQSFTELIHLKETLQSVHTHAEEFTEKYRTLFKVEKLIEIEKKTTESISHAMDKMEQIEDKLDSLLDQKQLFDQRLISTFNRLKNLEDHFAKNRIKFDTLEQKLTNLITKIDKNRKIADKHLVDATHVFQIINTSEDFKDFKNMLRETNILLRKQEGKDK